MDSFRLGAPYSAFLPTAERFPLEPYHIGLFLLQLLKCAALERSSVLLICCVPVAKRHACDFTQLQSDTFFFWFLAILTNILEAPGVAVTLAVESRR